MEIKANNKYQEFTKVSDPETKTGGFKYRTANLRSRLNIGGSEGYQEFGNIEQDTEDHPKKQRELLGGTIKRLIKQRSQIFRHKSENK